MFGGNFKPEPSCSSSKSKEAAVKTKDLFDEYSLSDSQEESESSLSDHLSEGGLRLKEDLSDLSNMSFICETLSSFAKEGSKYLPFREGELISVIAVRNSQWWKAENSERMVGLVPSTLLKIPDRIKRYLKAAEDSGILERNQFWDQLRKVVKGDKPCDMSWLSEYSTLAEFLRRNPSFSMKDYLLPSPDVLGGQFIDLHWNRFTFTLKPVDVLVQKFVKLVAFRDIFVPPLQYEVTSRHVRICLHDGTMVLSNIHTVKANWNPKTPKIWTFDGKPSVDSQSETEGHIFVRSCHRSTNLGVLFELCMTFRKENTDEFREMSCGWVFMRLLNDDGCPVRNRTKILKVNRGIPFTCPDPIYPLGKESALKKILKGYKGPRVVLSLSNPSRSANDNLNYLPFVLIGRVSSVSMILLYRMQLAEGIIENRSSLDIAQLIQSPFLAHFPRVIEEPDVFDVFKRVWRENRKRTVPYLATSKELQRKTFQEAFMESVFLILQSCEFPPYTIGNLQIEERRRRELARFYSIVSDGHIVTSLVRAMDYKPVSDMILTTPLRGSSWSFPFEV